jgi:hypothetical protein
MQRQTNPVRPTDTARRSLAGEVAAFAFVLLPLAALIEWRG